MAEGVGCGDECLGVVLQVVVVGEAGDGGGDEEVDAVVVHVHQWVPFVIGGGVR
ncbi:hypothetical protein [Microbacterium sp. CH12i]|uniref:hypothetical protein n=1 Tax=Microbacterium sp. CH12i TaxID=1479651 RepID=UPI001362F403|nr:hypothetical protein [Microbacterium sp. CH12i]